VHLERFELGQELAVVGLRSAHKGGNMPFIEFEPQRLVAACGFAEVGISEDGGACLRV
jgi:hypothetical protein